VNDAVPFDAAGLDLDQDNARLFQRFMRGVERAIEGREQRVRGDAEDLHEAVSVAVVALGEACLTA